MLPRARTSAGHGGGRRDRVYGVADLFGQIVTSWSNTARCLVIVVTIVVVVMGGAGLLNADIHLGPAGIVGRSVTTGVGSPPPPG